MRVALIALFAGSLVATSAGTQLETRMMNAALAPSSFAIALTGDSLITRRLSIYAEPEYVKLLDIVRGADAAFTNFEMLLHDFEPYPMPQTIAGTYVRAEPAIAQEIAWAGFDIVARANNHAGDYGAEGMRLTTTYLARAGLVQAGVGESLAEAREARFVDLPKARVSLVAATFTFEEHARAGRTRGDTRPRPGVNAVRLTTTYMVTRERLESLREILRELGLSAPAQGDELRAFGNRFVLGDAPAVRRETNREDLAEIAAVVKNASRLSDCTIVSIHNHEGSRFAPAPFLIAFAHAMVDAGADIVVGQGPHVLNGIEIYREKPILYSLGNFIFENETELRLPSEAYEPYALPPTAHVADFNDQRYSFGRRGFPVQREIWESVVAVLRFEGRRLTELVLHPITLGFGRPLTARGRPMLAAGDQDKKIIDDLIRLCQPFGTTIERRDGVAKVVLAPES